MPSALVSIVSAILILSLIGYVWHRSRYIEPDQAEAFEEENTPVTNPPEEQVLDSSQIVSEEPSSAVEEVAKTVIPPLKRGGRSRARKRDNVKANQGREERDHIVKSVELGMQKRGNHWEAGVRVVEDGRARVIKDGEYIEGRSKQFERFFPISSLRGSVDILFSTGERKSNILEGKSIWAFKIGREQRGSLVRSISKGRYLLFVPSSWRYGAKADIDILLQERTNVEGYSAYQVVFGEKGELAFTDREKLIYIRAEKESFSLLGERIEDERGFLFVGSVPRIRSLLPGGWESVSEVVVGQEGKGKGRWKTSVVLEGDKKLGVLEKSGWYFVRVYDKEYVLIDSFDFRYIPELRRINIPLVPLVNKNGHQPVEIDIEYEGHLVLQCKAIGIEVEKLVNKYQLRVLADPQSDSIPLQVKSDRGFLVELRIELNRLWWSIGDENEPPTNWQDTPLSLTYEDFLATSSKAIWIRIADKSAIEALELSPPGKEYQLRDGRPLVALREISHIFAKSLQGSLSLYLKVYTEKELLEVKVAEVKRELCCLSCDYTTENEEEMETHLLGHVFQWVSVVKTYQPDIYRRLYGMEFPSKIYKCKYCNTFSEAGIGHGNPTSEMSNHLKQVHPRNKARLNVISDLEEVQRYLKRNLPKVYQCTWCGWYVDANKVDRTDAQVLLEHFLKEHRNRLMRWQ